MGWLDGKVALITGAAAGIGRAVAERFVAEGARVGLVDIQGERAAALAEQLGAAVAARADVTDYPQVAAAAAQVRKALGPVDVVVANAGIFDGYAPLAEVPPEVWEAAFRQLFAVNVLGCLWAVRACLDDLRARSGAVVMTVSSAGFYPHGGGVLYTASKHALVGAVRQLAAELAPTVRVNGVAPGGTLTELSVWPPLAPYSPRAGWSEAERAARIAARNPLGLTMRPEDHTAAYVLLASDQSRAMTGVVIESDGGIGVRGSGR
jgi:NAD(P)-dependent dehydrogenase (short-subunit alcohol dehydrogenase family)